MKEKRNIIYVKKSVYGSGIFFLFCMVMSSCKFNPDQKQKPVEDVNNIEFISEAEPFTPSHTSFVNWLLEKTANLIPLWKSASEIQMEKSGKLLRELLLTELLYPHFLKASLIE